jgi:hypothetical protein
MPGATLTTMNSALRRIYTPDRLSEQLFQGNEFLDMLESGAKYKIGEVARVVIHKRRSGGTTFVPDGGSPALNAAGNQGIGHAEYKYKHIHQQIKVEEDVLEQTSNDALAVAEVLDVEVDGALNDLRKQLTRTLFGNGDGIICGVRTGSGTVIDLELLDGFNALERGWLFGDAEDGARVDVGSLASEAAVVDNQQVIAVQEDATDPQITVSGAGGTTTAGTHFVSWANARAGTTAFEPNGLRNIVSKTAPLGGLDPATTPVWRAAEADTTSKPLTLTLMLQMVQKVKQKSGSRPNLILTGLKQERKFYELLQQQVRYQRDSSIDAGNEDKATWHGNQIMSHEDCPNEDMYFLAKDHLFLLASRKPFWQNAITGGNILDWIQNTTAYGGKLAYHVNLASDRRNVLARLGGLT